MRNIYSVLFFIAIFLAIDIYAYQAIRESLREWGNRPRTIVAIIYWTYSIFGIVIFLLSMMGYGHLFAKSFLQILTGFYFALFAAKLVIIIFLLVDDVTRVLRWTYNLINGTQAGVGIDTGRLKFLSQIGLALSAIPFSALTYGFLFNAYNYKRHHISIKIKDLPDALEGFKIIQLSDIHSGSFAKTDPIIDAIERINQENPDLIFFTGDLVNDRAIEMDPYKNIFSKLKAKQGVYSILGNHDYGDYVRWPTTEEKKANLKALHQTHGDMGWNLMLNESKIIEKDGAKLAVIGVENWSNNPRFPKYGNIPKAYSQEVKSADVKVLLSHDPSHWDGEVNTKYQDIDLTLSGHTHGMQFGIEIAGFKWSPVQYAYKQWAGLYQKGKQYLYVNRGFGFIGYPGRVGILPEITVLELNKA